MGTGAAEAALDLCEALKASDFPCDVQLDDAQARLLARFLNVDAYTTGTLERSGTALVAHVRVVDLGGSGYAFMFTVTDLVDQERRRTGLVLVARDLTPQSKLEVAGKVSAADPDLPLPGVIGNNVTVALTALGAKAEAGPMPETSKGPPPPGLAGIPLPPLPGLTSLPALPGLPFGAGELPSVPLPLLPATCPPSSTLRLDLGALVRRGDLLSCAPAQ